MFATATPHAIAIASVNPRPSGVTADARDVVLLLLIAASVDKRYRKDDEWRLRTQCATRVCVAQRSESMAGLQK
jgi:hypothetical protein